MWHSEIQNLESASESSGTGGGSLWHVCLPECRFAIKLVAFEVICMQFYRRFYDFSSEYLELGYLT